MDAYTIPDSVNVNDITYVIDDEDHSDATTRYIVVDNQGVKEFSFAYVINFDPVGNFQEGTA
ncbi:MAG: hypothetical protein LBG52_02240 [Candidatus Peribacteria bacterium]|nr:hypothetical protein [Candidatus Peribacteria bacterium]